MKPDYFFFDTEFSALKKDAELISLGIVTQNGRHFYAEFRDFNREKCSEFVKSEVLPKMRFIDKTDREAFLKTDINDYVVYGNRELIKKSLLDWLNKVSKGPKTFVADVLAWDWILLVDLMATYENDSPKMPKGVHYIPLDIASLMAQKGIDPDTNRLQFCEKTGENGLHNALEDAKIAMKCWQILQD